MQPFKSRRYAFLLYLLGFFLFWEWLRPVAIVTNTDNTSYFILFTAFCFFLSFLKLRYWITFPAKFFALVLSLHALFFSNTSLFDTSWITYTIGDILQNARFMMYGSWQSLSDVFRTLLFFVLLWLVSFLMHYWLIQTRRLFLFFFVTIVYLCILDTFTYYHADGAIVRTIIVGFALLGLLRLAKVQETEQVTFQSGKLPVSMILALIGMILFSTVVGYAAPKQGPIWPDPVPFIQKAANGYGGTSSKGSMQKIGYDENDTQLGGPFKKDNTPIFHTVSPDVTYWRVEVKDTYTGKGWLSSKAGTKPLNKGKFGNFNILDLYGPFTNTQKETAKITYTGESFPQLIYGGKLEAVNGVKGQLELNEESGKIQPVEFGRHLTPRSYTLTYQYPSFSVKKLKQVNGQVDPQSIQQTYLKLPAELPERVSRLAATITAGKTNRYDKAKAVESYFSDNGYQYNTKNVAVPKKNQDYVDQFLFETKRGYCDNFSTSMVVMLRSIGIPARWVKGFTEGQYDSATDNGDFKYTITNNDAHSWVEVYFPNSGWVPFEPTPSFNNIFSFNYGTIASATTGAVPSSSSSTPKKTYTHQQKQDPQTKASVNSVIKKTPAGSSHKILWIILGVLALFVVVWMIYRMRTKWYPQYLFLKYRGSMRHDFLDKGIRSMFRFLSWQGYRRQENQTLREFAYVVDRRLDMRLMRDFVRLIEKYYYGGHLDSDELVKSKELWENIIKKSQS